MARAINVDIRAAWKALNARSIVLGFMLYRVITDHNKIFEIWQFVVSPESRLMALIEKTVLHTSASNQGELRCALMPARVLTRRGQANRPASGLRLQGGSFQPGSIKLCTTAFGLEADLPVRRSASGLE